LKVSLKDWTLAFHELLFDWQVRLMIFTFTYFTIKYKFVQQNSQASELFIFPISINAFCVTVLRSREIFIKTFIETFTEFREILHH